MNARVRLAFARGRLVFPLRQNQQNCWHWCALHRGQPDWSAIFSSVLKLLAIETTEVAESLQLAEGAGEVTWQRCWCGTTIQVQLLKFSERKRSLVAAALLKTARHS
jgi:hypothetical protein